MTLNDGAFRPAERAALAAAGIEVGAAGSAAAGTARLLRIVLDGRTVACAEPPAFYRRLLEAFTRDAPGEGARAADVDRLRRGGDRRAARLALTAWRAMYLLGRDAGEVLLLDAGRSGRIVAVRPAAKVGPTGGTVPPSAGGTVPAPAGAGEGGLRFGADLEWLIVDAGGGIVPASLLFPEAGPIGTDRQVVRGRSGRAHRPIAELRPAPQDRADAVVREAASLFGQAIAVVRRRLRRPFAVRAGARPTGGLSLGTHLHVSGIRPEHRLLRALDRYVALPFFCLEDPAGRRRRPRYGGLGDVRLKAHGGFEYRTLPSLFVDPALLRAAFALAEAVVRSQAALPADPLPPAVVRGYYAGEDLVVCPEARAALRRLQAALRRRDGGIPEAPAEAGLRAIAVLQARMDAGWRWREADDVLAMWGGDPSGPWTGFAGVV
ncbi:MAG: hypothetical protein HSCHL_0851 [Hydrogenibacillus schlegelii]|uniref:PhiEco32-like amidoligase-type 2 protein n=1 Tax=Hydrogenibacillus schlegelii TaxID=1484 RepID=A0A2T5GCT2_HYDSH|nr:hypothetical protein [Hydrogenibacillus schlegelii]PTQ53997.1 MAG: hypothetical protein HSCHL_0851 [Hydrogenibacillus schlegelii]